MDGCMSKWVYHCACVREWLSAWLHYEPMFPSELSAVSTSVCTKSQAMIYIITAIIAYLGIAAIIGVIFTIGYTRRYARIVQYMPMMTRSSTAAMMMPTKTPTRVTTSSRETRKHTYPLQSSQEKDSFVTEILLTQTHSHASQLTTLWHLQI